MVLLASRFPVLAASIRHHVFPALDVPRTYHLLPVASIKSVQSRFRAVQTSPFLKEAQKSARRSSPGATTCASPDTSILQVYLHLLDRRPLIVKGLTAGAIATAADITAQLLPYSLRWSETVSVKVDAIRSIRMGVISCLLGGLTLHLWYGFLARHLPRADLRTSVKKMMLGQFLCGPLTTALWFALDFAAQGASIEDIGLGVKWELGSTLIKGACFWPICDIINFRFTPLRLQPLCNNFAASLWTIYLSYVVNHKALKDNEPLL